MYERYNVFSFFESPVAFDSYARMQNAFIEALNRRIRIPKYVIVLPDSNLVEASAYFQFGMAEILGICVNWLAKQFEKNLEIHREDLVSKRPGAIHTGETRFIWVSMIKRPFQEHTLRHFAKSQESCAKFNGILGLLIDWWKNNHVMNIDDLHMIQDFDVTSKLNESGKEHFWKQLDHHFKQFDCKKTNLQDRLHVRPRPVTTHCSGTSMQPSTITLDTYRSRSSMKMSYQQQ